MKNFVLFQGGSGSMVAKAFAHFVALGLVDVPTINVQLCDKDAESADTAAAKSTINLVAGISAAGAIRPVEGNGICDEKYLFPTPLVRDEFDFSDSLVKIAKSRGAGQDAELPISKCVVERQEDDLLLNAFFSKKEQDESILIGFKGCASRGAVIYSYMLEHNCGVLKQIENAIAANRAEHIRVFVVGSIFGGTGASMFLKTVEKLRELDTTGMHIHIGGALLLPNFAFTPKGDCDIKSANFWKKTFTSLNGYADREDLVKKHAGDTRGLLDRLYLAALPNNELHNSTAVASEGGVNQSRVTDLIDVITANYITDFFNAPVSEENGYCCSKGTEAQPCTNIYTFNYPQNVDATPMELSAIPYGFGHQVIVMLVFSSMVFYMRWQLMNARRPNDIGWLRGLFGRDARRRSADIQEAVPAALENVFKYCCDFVEFIYQFSQTGKPQEEGFQGDYSSHYAFFDQTSINLIWSIKNRLMSGDPVSADEITRLQNCDMYRRTGAPLKKTAMSCLHDSLSGKSLTDNADDIAAALYAYLNNAYAWLQDCETN